MELSVCLLIVALRFVTLQKMVQIFPVDRLLSVAFATSAQMQAIAVQNPL